MYIYIYIYTHRISLFVYVISTKFICCGATWSAFEGGHWWPLWPEPEALRALQRAAQDGAESKPLLVDDIILQYIGDYMLIVMPK